MQWGIRSFVCRSLVPPLITSVFDHCRPPHSSSAPALLVASLHARSTQQQTAHSTVTQLLTDLSPALYVLLIAVGLCPLRLYVRRCNTTPSPWWLLWPCECPWWLLCLQWSVPPTTRTDRAAVRVDRPYISFREGSRLHAKLAGCGLTEHPLFIQTVLPILFPNPFPPNSSVVRLVQIDSGISSASISGAGRAEENTRMGVPL